MTKKALVLIESLVQVEVIAFVGTTTRKRRRCSDFDNPVCSTCGVNP
jgi:hypothetical protein